MVLTVGVMAMGRGASTGSDTAWGAVVALVLIIAFAVALIAVRSALHARQPDRTLTANHAPTIADEIASWLRGRDDRPTPPDQRSVDRAYFRERERSRLLLAFAATAAAIYLIFEALTCFCSHTIPGAVFGVLIAGVAWWSARRWHRLRVASEQVTEARR